MSLHLSIILTLSAVRAPSVRRRLDVLLCSYQVMTHNPVSHYGGNNPLEGEKCNLRLNQIQIYS